MAVGMKEAVNAMWMPLGRGGERMMRALWLVFSLLCIFNVRAETLDVTFTVKPDGSVVLENSWGARFTVDCTPACNQAAWLYAPTSQLPASMRDTTPIDALSWANRIWPVSHRLSAMNNNSLEVLIRPYNIALTIPTDTTGAWTIDSSPHQCRDWGTPGHSVSSGYIQAWVLGEPDGKAACDSPGVIYSSSRQGFNNHYRIQSYTFFSNLSGGVNGLGKLGLRAGTYKFPPATFTLSRLSPEDNYAPKTTSTVVMNVTVVVEPVPSRVDMPSSVDLVIDNNTAGDLVGKGVVIAQVHGNLGRNLRVQLRSPSGGKLVKGGETIPYTMDVTALAGDLKTRPLLDSKGGFTEAVIPLHEGIRDEFPLRFDINFLVPKSEITAGKVSSGLFVDTATLIFASDI
ncbi:hypothetical protein [Aeromonas sp. MdU4]|uniref:hypothetical protein n=1 Tax=Aeromonas sp. MdU4 TaxID=3342819 RepID=UPI0035B9DDF6